MPFRRHHEIKIYTSTGSMMCDLTKKYFREAGLDFDEVNISKDEVAKKELLSASGFDLTPTVDFDGRVIVGYQPDVYAILLKEDEVTNKKDEEDETKE